MPIKTLSMPVLSIAPDGTANRACHRGRGTRRTPRGLESTGIVVANEGHQTMCRIFREIFGLAAEVAGRGAAAALWLPQFTGLADLSGRLGRSTSQETRSISTVGAESRSH
ncbi:MAG TPA: hypothetical protein VMV15_15305 [Candidatus Binataceae bacterium]|nr:hypothetical protein [Candidatus Binataceae bacterium]